MIELDAGLKRLPPRERLKRAREVEAEKRLLLEEEITKREEELETLKEETERELEEAQELQEESLEELTREELEERVKRFKKGKEFLLTEDRTPSGFGEVSEAQRSLYQSEAFHQAQENLDYLLNAQNPRQSVVDERSRKLYQSVRELRTQFDADESYAFNKMQEQLYKLQQRKGVESIYVTKTGRLLNEMTDIIDYRREDEERQRRAA